MPYSNSINIFIKEIYPKTKTFSIEKLIYIFKNGDFSKKIYGKDQNCFLTQKFDRIDLDIKYNIQVYDTESLIGICTLIIPLNFIKEIKQENHLTYENKLRLTIDSMTKRKIFKNNKKNKNPDNVYLNLKIEIFLKEKEIIKINKTKNKLLKQVTIPISPRSFKKIPHIKNINNYKTEKPQHKFAEPQQYTIHNQINQPIKNILTTNEYLRTQINFKKLSPSRINKISKTNKLTRIKKPNSKQNTKKLNIFNKLDQKYFSGNSNNNPNITNINNSNSYTMFLVIHSHQKKFE